MEERVWIDYLLQKVSRAFRSSLFALVVFCSFVCLVLTGGNRGRLTRVYSLKFLVLLLGVQLLLKGLCYVVVSSGFLPILRALGQDAERTQVLRNVAMAPWSLKPLFGTLSDIVPLGGLHKKWWLALALLVGLVASAWMAIWEVPHAWFVTAVFFGLSYCLSWSDLLSEGKYSEILRDKNDGSAVLVFVNGAQRVGYVMSFALIGPLIASNHTSILMWVVCACCVMVLVPTLLNFMPETKRVPGEEGVRGCKLVMVDTAKARQSWKVIALVCLSGAASPFMALIPAIWDGRAGLILGMVVFSGVACVLVALSYFVFDSKWVAIVAVYEVAKRMGRLDLSSALDFYYLANEECCPGCPHLSVEYYYTVLGIVGSLTALLAVFIYQRWLSDMTYRWVCLGTALLAALGASTDVFVVLRWNLALHIPDSWAVLLGDAVIQPIVSMLSWLPGSLLLSRVCPPGLESSVFAFLAGVSNLGLFGSYLAGALVMNLSSISTTAPAGGTCNFAPLWWLVLVCHVALPIVVNTPVVLALLPNKSQSEQLLDDRPTGEPVNE